MKVGETLAGLAGSGEKIPVADGSSHFQVGRVRVRILSRLLRKNDQYGGAFGFNVVRGDDTERPIAEAIASRSPPGISMKHSPDFADGTPWYVSVFTCSHSEGRSRRRGSERSSGPFARRKLSGEKSCLKLPPCIPGSR